jgi:hypothetical protein
MSAPRLALWLCLIPSATGCGGSQQPVTNATVTTAPDSSPVEHPAEGYFLQATAEGATYDEAHGRALAQLEEALLGPEVGAAVPDASTHDAARDPIQRAATASGGVRVVLGLTRERAGEILAGIASVNAPAPAPTDLAASVAAIHRRHLEAVVCQRRQALLDVACDGPGPEAIEAAVRDLARTVRLRLSLAGGIPVDAAGRPLRPITVVAERQGPGGEWSPLPALPVRALQPEGVSALARTRAVTDQRGLAVFAVAPGAVLPDGVSVSPDLSELLGPLAEMWPRVELALARRSTDLHRWSPSARVRVRGQPASAAQFTAALERALGGRGYRGVVALTQEQLRGLQASPPGRLATTLPALADSLAGRADVLLAVEVDSQFASRMGPNRLWYEARGRLEAFDMWTGERLAAIEATVTASGFGDEGADREAQQQLASRLVEDLLAALPAR